eukprot:6456339-Amphidinium_carterae.1
MVMSLAVCRLAFLIAVSSPCAFSAFAATWPTVRWIGKTLCILQYLMRTEGAPVEEGSKGKED